MTDDGVDLFWVLFVLAFVGWLGWAFNVNGLQDFIWSVI